METRFDNQALIAIASGSASCHLLTRRLRSQRQCNASPRRMHSPQLLLIAGILAAGTAHASLIGDSVSARLVDFTGGVVAPQFAPTATVGGGVEFNGVWSFAPLGQVWNVALDLDASTFTISFNDVGSGATHDISGQTFLGLQLSDLDTGGKIIGVSVLSSSGAAVQSIGFTDHGVTVQWNVFQFRDANGAPLTGGSSTFRILSAVPEPSTWLLMAAGLAGLTWRHRLRQQAA